jgi:hypothetical protein
MKLLIIGAPRSGTTSLSRGIASQNYFLKDEPYNYDIGPTKLDNKYPLKELGEYKNIIVKTIGYQLPKEKEGTTPIDFGIEFSSHFDKTILLDRLIWDSHYEAYVNLFRKLRLGLDIYSPWTFDSLTKKDFQWAIENGVEEELKNRKKIISDLSENLNIPITYYEHLYSEDRIKVFEMINKWDLEDIDPFELLDYLDPAKKYRKENKDLI